MKNVRYLIIGGGVAGTTAAETIRQKDPAGSIAIVSDEPYRLYSRILLSKPNFFLEKIPFEQIWLKTESWYGEKEIELIAGRKAIKINPKQKEIMLDDQSVIKYEKLLLAIGSSACQWGSPVPKTGVYYLRTLDDARAIIEAQKAAKQAVSVGGGFVSFEMCEMMRLAGLDVTLILREAHFWDPILDADSAAIIEGALEKGGVKIIRSQEIASINSKDVVEEVILKDGKKFPCQMIIMGIGVSCPSDFIKETGIAVNRGVLTNEYLETNSPDIWVAGDAAEFEDVILGERVMLGNWVNAQAHGRTAGANMAGAREKFRLVSFYTAQGFGVSIAFVGDVRPASDRVAIPRGSGKSGSYGRIIVKDGEIIGATLINRTSELAVISKIIEKDIKVAGRETDLAHADFDLKTLIS